VRQKYPEAFVATKNILTRNKKKEAFALFQAGQWKEAKLLYAEVCELDPIDAEAWFFQGLANVRLGVIGEAEACLRRAIKLQPQRPEAHLNFGNILRQMGKFEEAESAYREALRLRPDMVAAHANMGTFLQSQGRLDEALAEYRAVVRLAVATAEAHFNLGNVQNEMGRFADAESAYREALRLRPGFVEAQDSLGIVLYKQGRYAEALEAHREASRIDPNFASAYYNQGLILGTMMLPKEAMAAYDHALRVNPKYTKAWFNRGLILTEQGLLEEAVECFRRAGSLDPGMRAQTVVAEAKIHEKRGDFKQAYALLEPFLVMDNPSVFAIVVFAAMCRPLGRCDEAIALMERVLDRDAPPIDNNQRAALHFELGRLYDLKSAFDKAFSHYMRANDIKGKGQPFNAQNHVRMVEAIIQAYNPGFMARAPRGQTTSRRPVFIVGMPRSGTSLVEQILASHPAVFGAGELWMIVNSVNDLPAMIGGQASYPSCVGAMTQGHVNQMAQRYLDHLVALSPDAERVIDKMPQNYLHLGLINLLFPEAHVIHCIRHPIDTCLSCYFQNFGTMHAYKYDMRSLGVYYRAYRRLMDHWATVLDIALMEVRYEELIADQEGISRAMLAFCGLEWDERCLRFYEAKRVVNTASYDQVRRPLYRQSLGRWKNYESYIGPLMSALGHDS
jgi:tetratricopeptide (TPR) repeat protein